MSQEIERKITSLLLVQRTNYQIKHFVIGQHDTPEMQYRQIVMEARDLVQKIRHNELQLEIAKKRIERLEMSKDEIDHLKAKQKKLGLAVLEDMITAAKRELAYLFELSKDYPDYSLDDIEANQSVYWRLRLTRQASADQISAQQGISAGNVAAMINAGLIQKELSK